jgi:hypothetical protein
LRATLLRLLFGVTLGCIGCGAEDPGPAAVAPSSERLTPSVLLLTLDTLRADHLGSYGYPEPISPNIDALARRGVV